ncbi:MAG: hypothetical protein LBH24_06195 [Clostridiales bacterium]|jgi:peptidoglycan/LPS O-acetylase OafA/YrhL|nr:hypothetical protein [Clostridiales bacterium]
MNKNFLFSFLIALSVLAAAILWILSVTVEAFAFFSWSWAVVIVAGGFGLAFLIKAVFTRNNPAVKKLYIFAAALFAVIAVAALVVASVIPDNIVFPIIAVIAAAALLLGVLVTGGRKWDTGDNQKVGYKNYYQRKAEEEKQAQKDKDQQA